MNEKHIQRTVADYLDNLQLLWCHIPNEEKSLSILKQEVSDDAFWGALTEMEQQGRKKGVPDVVIWESPPKEKYSNRKGLAIELKSENGIATDEQQEWLHRLTEHGWLCALTHGLEEAMDVIEKAGYT